MFFVVPADRCIVTTSCPGGEIGRRTSFRCWRLHGRGGSIPFLGTILKKQIKLGMHKTVYTLLKRIVFLWFMSVHAVAYAVFLDEIQVYDGEINEPGEFGLEIHANTTPVGQSSPSFSDQRTTQGGVRLTPEFSYGLTKTIELGFYLPTVYTQQYGYESAGYKPRIKWLPLQGNENQPWSAGVNFEYSLLNTGMEFPRKSFEIRGIVAWKNKDWSLAFNPVIDSSRSEGQDSSWVYNYQARAIKLVNDPIISGYGIEYYQGQAAVNNTDPNSTPKQIFAILELKTDGTLLNGTDVHVGLGYGWNSADPLTLKFIFTPKF